MQRRNTRQGVSLTLERLETRECPAFNIFYHNAALVVRGRPTVPYVAQGDGLNFNLLAGGSLVQIEEVGNAGATVRNLGTYRPVRNLLVQMAYTNTDVNFNLNGGYLASNVILNLGKGDIRPVSINSVNFTDGTIGGNLTAIGGNGIEIFNVGQSDVLGALPVTIRGSVRMVGRQRQDPFGEGDSLFIHAGSQIHGILSTFGIDNIDLGEATGDVAVLHRSLSMNVFGSKNPGRLNLYGEVARNVYFQGTNTLNPFITDTVTMHTDNPTPALIRGSLIASYAYGDARMILEENTRVMGDVTFWANGAGSQGAVPPAPFFNQLILEGAIEGSMRFHGGNGESQIIFTELSSILGDFSLRMGDGDNDLSYFAGTIDGALSVYLGNGNNIMTISQAPGDGVYWISGNGDSELTLGDSFTQAGSYWFVQLGFGTGNNTLTLDSAAPATQLISGVVRSDNNLTANTFNQGATWDLLSTLRFINFP